MKIAICFERPDVNSGPARVDSFLTSSLVEKGFDVACVSLKPPIENQSFQGFSSIKKWFLPEQFLLFPIHKPPYHQHNFAMASALRKCVRNFKPDVVINSSVFAGANILWKIKALKVVYVHSPFEFQFIPRSFLSRIYFTPILQLHQSALKKVNKIVCNSEYIKRLESTIWKGCINHDKFTVINPCIDWQKFQRINSRRRRVAYVGRIDPGKGIDLVINAFLKADVEASELVICGTVNPVHRESFAYFFKLQTRIKNLDDNRIKVVTNPTQNKLIDVYATSRCFANYSPREGFGLCVIEAMASGTPTIVADCGGQRETVSHGQNGFRLKFKHPEDDMAKYMKLLLTDDRLFSEASSLARNSARQFDKSIFVGKWIKLLDELIV